MVGCELSLPRGIAVLLNGAWELKPFENGCDIALFSTGWSLRPELVCRLGALGGAWRDEMGSTLWLFSGGRTCMEQERLAAEGRPAASCEVSTHVIGPLRRFATGADVGFDRTLTTPELVRFGQMAECLGLRWGGGSDKDYSGIPFDFAHVDLGPRSQTG
mgnify:CR=1 FL=1